MNIYMTSTSFIRAGLIAAALLFPVSSHAQFAANSNAPLDGSSDEVEYLGDVTIFSGQVDIRQATTRILSDVMKVYGAKNQVSNSQAGVFNDVERIEAIGNFYYITPDQEVRGERGVYVQATDTFTVTGNVILLQGKENIVTGDTLIYNLTTNEAKVVGTCKGRKCGDTGRVKILIKNTGNGPLTQPAS